MLWEKGKEEISFWLTVGMVVVESPDVASQTKLRDLKCL